MIDPGATARKRFYEIERFFRRAFSLHQRALAKFDRSCFRPYHTYNDYAINCKHSLAGAASFRRTSP
jgi:hypothetical protein